MRDKRNGSENAWDMVEAASGSSGAKAEARTPDAAEGKRTLDARPENDAESSAADPRGVDARGLGDGDAPHKTAGSDVGCSEASPNDVSRKDASRNDASDDREAASGRRRSIWRWMGPALSLTIVAISIFVLAHTLAQVSLADIRAAVSATSYRQLATAFLFTGVSYIALTGYDAIALRQLRLKVPYRTTAIGSFTSYAISFTVGFYIVTAGAVRYWIYSRAGLPAAKIATLTVIAGVTFWLGTAVVIGFGLVFQAAAVSSIDQLSVTGNIALGLGLLALILGYLVWVSVAHRWIRIKGFYLELPGFRLTLGQMVLGVVDVCAGAAALYVLLPAPQTPGFPMFAAIYALACLLGMASNAPASAGVLEATMFKILATSPALIASVILFRVIYYLVPFALGLFVLFLVEGLRRIRAPTGALAGGSKS